MVTFDKYNKIIAEESRFPQLSQCTNCTFPQAMLHAVSVCSMNPREFPNICN